MMLKPVTHSFKIGGAEMPFAVLSFEGFTDIITEVPHVQYRGAVDDAKKYLDLLVQGVEVNLVFQTPYNMDGWGLSACGKLVDAERVDLTDLEADERNFFNGLYGRPEIIGILVEQAPLNQAVLEKESHEKD